MSWIPQGTARAIDRLARGAHAFHRFAHHPLCGEYAGEVLAIGRRARICLGCALAALGAACGAILGASIDVPVPVAIGALLLGPLLASASPRAAGKIASRFLPSILVALAMTAGPALALGGILTAAGFAARYRRRGPDRTPCATCPEREASVPCRGYAPIVRRERAFSRLVSARFRL